MFGLHIIRRSTRVKNMQHCDAVCNVAAPCSHVRVHVCRRKEYVSAATRMSAYASWCKRQVATAPWHEVSGPVLEQCGSRDLARGARAQVRACVCVCVSVGGGTGALVGARRAPVQLFTITTYRDRGTADSSWRTNSATSGGSPHLGRIMAGRHDRSRHRAFFCARGVT